MTPIKQITKKELAKKLGVSRSSLYYHHKLPAKDKALKELIELTLTKHPEYGHKRLALELQINKKRILRAMNKCGIKPRRRRVQRPKKLDDQGNLPSKFPNVYKLWCPLIPGVLWAGDFTYFYFQGKFYYLATFIDVCTREIVGCHIASNHSYDYLIHKALDDALEKHPSPLWSHTDQGAEYTSASYAQRCYHEGIQISMSDKGSPWQNGFQESFYGKFKVSLGRLDQFESLGELVAAIHQTLYYYNHKRIHTSLKMSPIRYKQLLTTTSDRLRV